ncbi:MAG: carboxyltransferase domain-containing protein [Paracoccaceae bacterium]
MTKDTDNRDRQSAPVWPQLGNAGVDGILLRFSDRLSEPANRAALAFRAALEAAMWPEISESATSLVSVYLRFDPVEHDRDRLIARLSEMAGRQDWFAAPLPPGRRLWRIPTAYGGAMAPQLAEAADAAGLTPEAAVAELSTTRVRVQTLGFAPGQPYLGELPPNWNIPRQSALTPRVPVGALVVAIRQLVLFSASTPTGWRHVGQTAFRAFRPESDTPFVLKPGDEVVFEPAAADDIAARIGDDGDGGARSELLP